MSLEVWCHEMNARHDSHPNQALLLWSRKVQDRLKPAHSLFFSHKRREASSTALAGAKPANGTTDSS